MISVLLAGGASEAEQQLADRLRSRGVTLDVQAPLTALGLVLLGGVDVVVATTTDVELDGFRMCPVMRDLAVATPVIIVGFHGDDGLAVQAFDAGADDTATERTSSEVLAGQLRALSRRRPLRLPEVVRVGDLVVDPALRTVCRGEVGVRLTDRELAVLRYLMQRADAVVSKADLHRALGGGETPEDLNVVEACVSSLRRKVDTPFGSAMIVTVYGLGYRLSDPQAA